MAWWERPWARLRGGRTPSGPTSTAPAVASATAPGEWNDVPRLQRVLADPITPVAINDDFRDSLASFSDPSLLAPLSHRVDPAVGGLVEGLAIPGRQHAHNGPELVVRRSVRAAPTVQRRTTWGSDAAELAVVPLEYRYPVGDQGDTLIRPEAEPFRSDAEPAGTRVEEAVASSPERSDAVAGPAPAPPAVQRTIAPAPGQVGPATSGPPEALPVQRVGASGPASAGLPTASGGEPREPSPDRVRDEPSVTARTTTPMTDPAPAPSVDLAARPVVQRAGTPSEPPVLPVQRAGGPADAVEPDEPGFTELPLVVAPPPPVEVATPTPDAADAASDPIVGDPPGPPNRPAMANQPVVQQLPSARELPVAPGVPGPRTAREEPALQRLAVGRSPADVAGGVRALPTVPDGLPIAGPSGQSVASPGSVVQRATDEIPGRAGEDGPAAGWSSTEVPLPTVSPTSGPAVRTDPTVERFVPPAVVAPPIAAVQRRGPAAPEPPAVSADPMPGVQRVTAEATASPQPPLMLVRPSASRRSGSGPAPGEGMSFAAMFAGFAAEASEPESSAESVQRQVADDRLQAEPAEPSAAPMVGAGMSPAPAAAASGDNLDELARRLYEPLAARLRGELWLDRERAGLMTELA